MGWNEAKIQFQIALEQDYLNSSISRHFFNSENSKKSVFFCKGKRFLKSIEELRNFFNPEAEILFEDILNAATKILKNPEEGHQSLIENIDHLKGRIKKREEVRSCTGVGNFLANSIFAAVGSALAMAGIYTVYNSIALLSTGAFVLASGPMLWLAIGIGAILIGLFIAGMTAYDAYTNYRFHKESQIKEIEEFANLLSPHCSVDEEQLDGSLAEKETDYLAHT
ncbi:hypothetical protein [Legionella micdadei]|uniref:Uncharacterized protein n=1 Tax=Legionella micdadei TaxID=451 RepID=A0A098GCV2_LEGMI|nr:hypothetical protein [Legionella micdadei]ARG98055.1 hypothetical protein B6N58_10490 [Legionella micdadei]ARH00850.1 hypothetical protein B6V88_10710 [Legionella micdadei]KTD30119.1 hypothetical protein Lmic_0300 [Legionella micdadei]NSL18506.1 hypothetical protein [Legionella micdadei]CEG60314.1 protein of unknown function [Legionella micdadei]